MGEPESSALHVAINNGYFRQVRFLIDQGADVNRQDRCGKTPLILCSLICDDRWSIGLARLLIEYGARISKCDLDGYNALHHACINQKNELVDVYLTALDCDINSKCRKGNTSLHYAASLGNKPIVQSLAKLVLKYKQNLDPINKRGLTPLHQAFKANQVDCGDLLVELGADRTLVDTDGVSAVQHRQAAMSRLQILALKHTRSRPPSRLLRQLKADAEKEKPEQDVVAIATAKDFDLRNDPEYVFKTKAVHYFHGKEAKLIRTRPKSAVARPSDVWKDSILSLWSQYETKYSESFRKPAIAAPVCAKVRCDSIMSAGGLAPQMSRRNSRIAGNSKSRAGSLTIENGAGSRRSSTTTRRNGMPPLVKAQSRATLGLTA